MRRFTTLAELDAHVADNPYHRLLVTSARERCEPWKIFAKGKIFSKKRIEYLEKICYTVNVKRLEVLSMAQEKKINLPPDEDDFIIGESGVCDIEDFIGSDEDLCVEYFSQPGVEYNYGYNFICAVKERCRMGYFIGVDRFCQMDGKWGKEYALKEYAVYIGSEAYMTNRALFQYLIDLAKEKGCSRIVCENRGGNTLFWQFLEQNGFVEDGENWILDLPNAVLPEADQLVIPKEGEALDLFALFFLREQGFVLNKEICRFAWEDESIVVNRKTGVCEFSEKFSVVGDGAFVVNGEKELCMLEICSQLLKYNDPATVEILLPSAKATAVTPDIRVGDAGYFVSDEKMSLKDRQALRLALKQEGQLKKYGITQFYFDFEVGGRHSNLAYSIL